MAAPFRPRKRLGQHFLVDPNIARKIVAALQAAPEDPVVEIGPGTGALTGLLLERYPHLTAIEIDPRAVAELKARWPELDVRQEDVLKVNWAELAEEKGGRLHVVGNLPYYITSPILFALLDAREALAEAVLMMQREVAERLVAPPGSKTYGILSVAAQLWATPALLFPVSRHVFRPKPRVESAVVRLTFERPLPDVDPELLRQVIRTAFNQRRKTLRNSLRRLLPSGTPLPDPWAQARAEDLSPDDYVALTRWLHATTASLIASRL
ncbi:16S rRNA (adenine(1518)-N(6)/adenine(1519)-N(6))-dimethyltransferase RsmA [Rhodothermus marinus]|uniref:Ribosomal RNA small subunit methyltransferase A n=1 Tax=Rhodothermus marinus (strain ATCC 43812 / DSM 4252 / R-10) TaxID=518766 RepID=D0MFY7_RHOM4|nr:16S rRNA (adenine(1518)-N(6)/adenine(1519)-N(6))-dimethyltransferase RsmA [Rhodothermus marinus]ACY49476.1 dimethyladenosine transferase [Rhodothermus marinus DSM 4252]